MNKKVALVTGGNRGLGMGICRQLARENFHVVLGSRDPAKGQKATDELRAHGLEIEPIELDVSSRDDIERLRPLIVDHWGRIDVLVNCAGITGESGYQTSVLDVEDSELRRVLEVNFFGALHMCQVVVPFMKERGYGRVVNVSSGMGQLSDMGKGSSPYRFSKASLNVLTRILGAELDGTNVKVNSVCPGWVRTDMGGPNATRSIDEGARGIVWAATLPDDGPNGGFFRDGKRIDW